jgi:dihydrodipicolinate synthase/N-acetylneuraminate lyase
MQRLWFAASVLAASVLFSGCDSGGSATISPDEAKAAVDATKKYRESHSKPQGGVGGTSSAAAIAKQKSMR